MLTVSGIAGLPEIGEGDDLAALILAHATLSDGDIVVVTSKIVSKAEGRLVAASDRDAAITAETVRVVAERGSVRIVENRLGIVAAAAGVDASNVPDGHVLLLPVDPDASARRLAERLRDVADELCAAAELVKPKDGHVPVAVVSGRPDLVGDLVLPGARSIVRSPEEDLFRTGG
jgi:coenzyme F420-0:L-glutamate ligase/coenzyme F420-1:gamma-L-glutamate ligase